MWFIHPTILSSQHNLVLLVHAPQNIESHSCRITQNVIPLEYSNRMRVAIIIRSGPNSGQRFVLKAGQIATVGQSAWNDFSFPSDDQMQESQFQILCEREAVYLQDLSQTEQATIDGVPIEAGTQIPLQNGSVVRAGRTELMISIEGLNAASRTKPTDAVQENLGKVDPVVLASRAEYLELSPAAMELITKCTSATEAERILLEEKTWDDCLRWRGFHIERIPLVHWFYELLSNNSTVTLGTSSSTLLSEALLVGKQWIDDPNEENRRQAEAKAVRLKRRGAIGSLLSAIGWSGGSLTLPPLEPIIPDARLTSQCVSTGVQLLAHQLTPDQLSITLQRWIETMPSPDYQNIESKL